MRRRGVLGLVRTGSFAFAGRVAVVAFGHVGGARVGRGGVGAGFGAASGGGGGMLLLLMRG